VDKSRKNQGWASEKYDSLQIEILPRNKWWAQGVRIIKENPDAIHAFVGFWTIRAFFPLILFSLSHNIKTAIFNEPYSNSYVGYFQEESIIASWLKVKLRPVLYSLTALLFKIIARKNLPCLLSLSLLAKEQFIKSGFEENNLFPFGYFVEKQNVDTALEKDHKGRLKLIFVGALLRRKGLDIAIEAVESLAKKGFNILLDVYGSGDPGLFFSPSSGCVRYKGVIPQGEVQKNIAQYDLLILPSRHDGWGVVVNEALLQGVPVIVSNHVGSKCLVENTGAGMVFCLDDPLDLSNKIESVLLDHKNLNSLKSLASKVASEITPDIAAKYLLDVFNFYFFDQGKKPTAIWVEN
jgi:glycosyltransferase involved in cell wall biosynthesis